MKRIKIISRCKYLFNELFSLLHNRGAFIIEFALTIPVILHVILFAFELIEISLEQTAADTICRECSFSLVEKGNVTEFDKIFKKYLPRYFSIGRARFYCRVYSNMDTIMNASPYGGESIYYPQKEDGGTPISNADSCNFGPGSDNILLNTKTECKATNYISGPALRTGKLNAGQVFVLTVVLRHKFSSAFVGKLFNGGKNTNKDGYYILWSRGAGVISG